MAHRSWCRLLTFWAGATLQGGSPRHDARGMGFSTRLTDEMVRRYRRSGHWGDETFSAILERRAAAHPEREALVDRRHRVTYAELAARVDRVAAKLKAGPILG